MTWGELELAAPEIATLGRERLERVGLALLGTLRRDGWPRIGPVEPHLTAGRLLVGVMPRSLKARDLARDSRCTLQSIVTDPDSGDPELKLYGRAVEVAEDELRNAPRQAWWSGRKREDARVFDIEIIQAAFVTWDVVRGEMTVRSWARGGRQQTTSRPYP